MFGYADAHRVRIGTNFNQLPVNRSVNKTNSYTFDGHMRFEHSGNAPVYSPNSFGRPYEEQSGIVENSWEADGELIRSAYTLHPEDDDFSQAGTLVREVFTDEERTEFVQTVAGALSGVVEPVLSRAFAYWKNVDPEIGCRIEHAVKRNAPTATATAHTATAHTAAVAHTAA